MYTTWATEHCTHSGWVNQIVLQLWLQGNLVPSIPTYRQTFTHHYFFTIRKGGRSGWFGDVMVMWFEHTWSWFELPRHTPLTLAFSSFASSLLKQLRSPLEASMIQPGVEPLESQSRLVRSSLDLFVRIHVHQFTLVFSPVSPVLNSQGSSFRTWLDWTTLYIV